MALLVLGGTVFLGRHVVEAALRGGHDVTIFSRGLTQPDLFPEVRKLCGDRDGDLGPLMKGRWDAVIDTCGFVPRVVEKSMKLRTDRYVFVSTVSVYRDLSTAPTEDSPTLPAPDHEDVGKGYGALKAACEEVVRSAYGERSVVVRPGLLGGPHDPTGRFSYWPSRFAEGGRVLAPLPREAPTAVLDVRDLAAWLVDLATGHERGTFNAVGLPRTRESFLDTVRAEVGAAAEVAWVEPERLTDVTPWSELPLWLPDPEQAGMMAILPERAVNAGLKHRPLAQTVRDTLSWAQTLEGPPPRQVDGRYAVRTLSRAKERQILGRTGA